ncbi:hypothetical protein N5079_34115 [Planotetraspora sp. A-T 1434]|uniref:hypothetical protein n=1 Tax=Planotetraspora sp. A-T 1434 TaxID=2979219 RepID=UPI0021C12DD9|nr:hypothetical protein [Planotetraspora sp. A-T 1434]MCT9935250.1 hypothetical protein [Planotetraspora sp. A-T 1434]
MSHANATKSTTTESTPTESTPTKSTTPDTPRSGPPGGGGEPVAESLRAAHAVGVTRRMVELLAWREASAAFLPTPPVPAPTTFGGPDPGVAVRLLACPWCSDLDMDAVPPAGALRLVPAREADPALPVLTLLSCESLEPRALLPIVLAARACAGPVTATFTTRAAWRAARLDHGRALDEGDLSEELNKDPSELARLLWRLNAAESWLNPLLKSATPDDPPRAFVRLLMMAGEPLAVPAATRPRLDLDDGGTRAPARETLRPRFLGPHATGPALDQLDADYRSTRDRVSAALLDGSPVGTSHRA